MLKPTTVVEAPEAVAIKVVGKGSGFRSGIEVDSCKGVGVGAESIVCCGFGVGVGYVVGVGVGCGVGDGVGEGVEGGGVGEGNGGGVGVGVGGGIGFDVVTSTFTTELLDEANVSSPFHDALK